MLKILHPTTCEPVKISYAPSFLRGTYTLQNLRGNPTSGYTANVTHDNKTVGTAACYMHNKGWVIYI